MEEQQSNVLVVFYSRTGVTRKTAVALQKALGCDIEEITERDSQRRQGLKGYLRSFFEAISQRPADIHPVRRDPASYDLVVFGTPVWGSTVSSPARSYLNQCHGKFRDVAFFVTHGGSGTESVFKEMQSLSGRTPIATLAVRQKDLREGVPASIREFAAILERRARPRAKAA